VRVALQASITLLEVVALLSLLSLHAFAGASVINSVGIDQRLGNQLDLSVMFRDETGASVQLRKFFNSKPIIIAPVYFSCTSLCPMTLHGLAQTLRILQFDAGREFDVIAFSFDPDETPALAAKAKAQYLKDYKRRDTEPGLHFLTGDADSIRRLTDEIGFRFNWDGDTQQWAHAAAILVASPTGKIAQYFYGLEYSARDLRLSLVQASAERIGTLADRLLLYCYRYDPATGRYGLVVIRTVRIFAAAVALSLFTLMFVLFRRESPSGIVRSRR